MSCHGCATKFGVFTKEKGCPSCGFAFCKKCLRFKAVIPRLGITEQNVCKSCYDQNSSEKRDEEKECRSPPDVFLRRLESLENPARPPITVYHHDSRMEQLKTGLTAEDREIAERLEKLKDERKRQREVPTEEDIVRRLAALKGQNPETAVEVTLKKKEVFNLPDTRSNEQKTNDLIKQLIEEQILAVKHISPEELIAKRLARLRGDDAAPTAGASPDKSNEVDVEAVAGKPSENTESSEHTDDFKTLMKMAKTEWDAVQKELKPGMKKSKTGENVQDESEESEDNQAVDQVVRRAMDEAALGIDDAEKELESTAAEDTEELPWCTICNEDAIIRCVTCDGDLYCNRCFAEFHDDEDMKRHRTVPFKSQRED
ncbi:Uncharacterized protein GBIM_09612 [Gryllus bimaculatus]|nr:Uncharacterized protein GBIM_09612 [Gryllus bimaculatus]